jgi:low affinity Fe/Cu permease
LKELKESSAVASQEARAEPGAFFWGWHGSSGDEKVFSMKTMSSSSSTNRESTARVGVFQRFARSSSRATGHPLAFGLAMSAIVLWAVLGPAFAFSNTWQLVINTATTIVTFLMVFLIQNTQNRDSEAMQLKLDELIRATEDAHNAVLDIEELSEIELDQIKLHYEELARQARENLRTGGSDLGRPDFPGSKSEGRRLRGRSARQSATDGSSEDEPPANERE